MKNTKKGSVFVEASIILPLFLIAILIVAYTIITIGASLNVMHSLSDEARYIQTYAYDVPYGGSYVSKIEKRIKNTDNIDSFKVKDMDYLFGDGYISIDSKYKVKIGMPIKLRDDFNMKESVLFRGFVPHDNSSEIISFEEMQTEDDGTLVWIFPESGERYHDENCPYIKVEPFQSILSDEIRGDYSPCRLCRPDEYTNGHIVYVFRTGEVYHSGECTTVERFVVSVTKKEAVMKGYTPCSKCGG